MFAGYFEEICQIHFVSAVGISRKTDGFDERFIVAIGVEKRAVNAAEVDKVEGCASHDEHWLKFVAVGHGGKVNDPAAACVHGELANASQLSVYQRLIRQKLGLKFDPTACAKNLLRGFVLYR